MHPSLYPDHVFEPTTPRKAGGLDFTAIGGKRQGREVPQSLRVEPGAKHPVWKTQSARPQIYLEQERIDGQQTFGTGPGRL